jgi:hypothetical protein
MSMPMARSGSTTSLVTNSLHPIFEDVDPPLPLHTPTIPVVRGSDSSCTYRVREAGVSMLQYYMCLEKKVETRGRFFEDSVGDFFEDSGPGKMEVITLCPAVVLQTAAVLFGGLIFQLENVQLT